MLRALGEMVPPAPSEAAIIARYRPCAVAAASDDDQMLAVDTAVDGWADWPTFSSGGSGPVGAGSPVSSGDIGGRPLGGAEAGTVAELAADTAACAISSTSTLFTDPLL